ncbi:MAG: hypothetical protein ACTSPD_16780, partial [Promethearchaeota archaeon]
TNGTIINVPINRTEIGIFNYTIEYYDNDTAYGNPDTVIITVIMNNPPQVNHPSDISTTNTGSETIDWMLTDDLGSGKYRVIANNSLGNYYVWVNWTDWTSGTIINVPINRTEIGIFNYTIEYYDVQGVSGISDTVIVKVEEESKSSSGGSDKTDEEQKVAIAGYNLYIILSLIGLSGFVFKKLSLKSRY